MGWTGGQLPEGQTFSARAAIEFELGAEFYAERVIDAALVGSTVYAAIRGAFKPGEVVGLVLLTERRGGSLYTKAVTEDMGPAEDGCPARILDQLTETDSEHAQRWRQRCRNRIDLLGQVRNGTHVRFDADYLTPEGPCRDFVCVDRINGRFRSRQGHVYSLTGWRKALEAVIS